MSAILRPLRHPVLREVLLWSLPALLVGLILRVVLTIQSPYGVFHNDTPDFLTTPDRLIFDHGFELHSKKTFLVPILFTIPFVLHLPALIVIPLFQHALGLTMVALVGGLTRLWFVRWRLFIIPLTLIAAANPFFLWYEHTLMAESIFVFTTVLLTFVGTLYVLERTWTRFWFLCLALVLEAGARPEGKLLFGFGLFVLLLVHQRAGELPFSRQRFRRSAWPRFIGMFVLAVVMHFLTKTSQAGLLLYTSVARLTPTELKIAPGFDPYIAPLRADLQHRWADHPSFPKVRDRRLVSDAVTTYLKENPEHGATKKHRSVNDFCLKLAIATCRQNFFGLPNLAYHKFRAAASEAPSGMLDNEWLFDKQRSAFTGDRSERLSRGLTGTHLPDSAEINAFIDAHYASVPWLNSLSDHWMAALNWLHFPDWYYQESGFRMTYPGLPIYFLVAGFGVVVIMFRRGELQLFHIAWSLTLLAFFYTIMLTANVRPRFRFVFEPYWYLYLALLLDTALLILRPRALEKQTP